MDAGGFAKSVAGPAMAISIGYALQAPQLVLFSLLTIYASISLGQLFSSHKVLASILCYLGLSTILSTAMMLLTTPTTAGVFILQSTSANPMTDFASIYWSIMLISLFANLVLCVPAFWICNYVMKRCLNLD